MLQNFKSYDDLIKAAGVTGYDFRKHNAIPGIHTLYCRRTLTSGAAIPANTELKFFHKGQNDDAANVGGTSGTAMTLEDTNLQAEGRLPEGELFVCTGVAFQLPHDITKADYLGLVNATVAWTENAGSRSRILGQFEEFPALVKPSYILRDMIGVTATGAEERLVRSEGRAFISGAPLFYIRGGVPQHDQGYLGAKLITALTPSATIQIKARLYGVHFQLRVGNN